MSSKPFVKPCAPYPHEFGASDPLDTSVQSAVFGANKLWELPRDGSPVLLKLKFLDGTPAQAEAVLKTVKTWSTFANVEFKRTESIPDSTIRVSFGLFDKNASWSTVGTDAEVAKKDQPGGATIHLGWLKENANPTVEDAGTILHEFGHVLGMMHEHQSPARGGTITLKLPETYLWYGQYLPKDRVKSQVIDVYNLSAVSNYSRLDTQSIMMYFMDKSVNEQGLTINPNLKLSDLDKAFITLNYPRKVPAPDGMSIGKALEIAGVSGDVASKILKAHADGDLQGVRDQFIANNQEVMNPTPTNVDIVPPANPLANVLQQLAQSLLKALLGSVLAQHGVNPATLSAVAK